MRTLDVLAKRNEEWLKMAKSFGVNDNDGWELVQGMYEKLNAYVKDVNKIMYNETEVNTFFVYTTLSNLFKSGYHQTGAKGGLKNRRFLASSHLIDATGYIIDDSFYLSGDCPEDYESFRRKSEMLSEKLSSDEYIDDNGMFDSLYVNIVQDIDNYVETWYWYDKKLFRLYYDKGMSMRKIAKETKISLKSVFNSLKKAKHRIREEFGPDYYKYKESIT